MGLDLLKSTSSQAYDIFCKVKLMAERFIPLPLIVTLGPYVVEDCYLPACESARLKEKYSCTHMSCRSRDKQKPKELVVKVPVQWAEKCAEESKRKTAIFNNFNNFNSKTFKDFCKKEAYEYFNSYNLTIDMGES